MSDSPATLPVNLQSRIGTRVNFSRDQLRALLLSYGLAEDVVGGSIDSGLSRSSAQGRPQARYFVIHDTSVNLCEDKQKLMLSDRPDAPWNRADRWSKSGQAHLFITRDGKLVSPQGRTFATPWRATKLEDSQGIKSRGLFLHVENVQLRVVDPSSSGETRRPDGHCLNDRIAQQPGLSQMQLDRLALAYVAASFRAKQWLIPAYHAVIDQGLPDGHDDPQNFDLPALEDHICAHLSKMGTSCHS